VPAGSLTENLNEYVTLVLDKNTEAARMRETELPSCVSGGETVSENVFVQHGPLARIGPVG